MNFDDILSIAIVGSKEFIVKLTNIIYMNKSDEKYKYFVTVDYPDINVFISVFENISEYFDIIIIENQSTSNYIKDKITSINNKLIFIYTADIELTLKKLNKKKFCFN